ncbi:MAG: type IV pilus assembly protein FimV, partial [Marinicella sp.]
MKQKLILLTLVIGLTIVSQSSFSLGLGKIQVYSALDEPLVSSIDLLANADDELLNLNVKLASSEDYQKVGLDKSFVPGNIMVSFDEDNPYRINVTSNGPVTEPIVSLLLDVNWNNGRILREFTVLLDPPVYDTISPNVQLNQAVVKPMEDNSIQAVEEPEVVENTETTVDAVDVSPSIEPAVEESTTYTNEDLAAYEEEVAEPEVSYSNTSSEVLVEAGDTLWRIANQNKVGDLSAHQMMMAIYNNNTDAFIDNNINKLIKGSSLTIPTAEEARNIGFSEALAQVESHHQSWAPAQQEYSSYQTESYTTEEVNDEPTGLDYGVQLSGNDSDGSDSGQSNSDEGSATEVQAMEEDLFNKDSENTDLKERISELEDIVELQQDAIEIKDDGLSNLENQLASAEDTTDEVLAEGTDAVEALEDDIWDGVDEVESATDEATDELSLAIDSVATDGTTEDGMTEDDADNALDTMVDAVDEDESVVEAQPEPESTSPPKFGGATEESFVDKSINWVMDNLKWVLMGLVGLILLIFLPRVLRSSDDGDDTSFLDDIKGSDQNEDSNEDVEDIDLENRDNSSDDTKMNKPLDLEDEEIDSEDDVLAELDKSIVFDESSDDEDESLSEFEGEVEDETETETAEDDGFDVAGFLNDDEDSNTSVTADHSATLADVSFDDDDESNDEVNTGEDSDDEDELQFDEIDLDFDDDLEEVASSVEDTVDDVVEDLEDVTEDLEDMSEEAVGALDEAVDEVEAEADEAVEAVEEEFSFDDDFDFDLDEELEELEQSDDAEDDQDQNEDAEESDEFNDMLDISEDAEESFEIIEEEEVGMDEEIDLGLEDLLEDADAIDTKLDLAKA